MIISDIELYRVKIPLAKNKPGFFAEHPYFEPSWIPGFRQSEMRFYLIRLVTDSGIEGFSAMPCMATERDGLGPLLGNYILGMNPLDTGLVNQRIQEFAYLGMRNGWIEAAFWDIIGKAHGKPLYEMLGGNGGIIYPYASTGETHRHDQKIIAAIVKKRKEEGFRGIKLRVKGTDLNEMIDFAGAARHAAGADMDIMIDANQGWPVDILDETPRWSLKFAADFAKGIEPFHIKWLEEPLNKGNFKGLADLRSSTTTPIAGGEMNSSWTEFQAMLNMGCLDVYQPDAMLIGGTYAGGISVTKWLIDEIRQRNIAAAPGAKKSKYSPHTWTTGLGFAVGLQLVGLLTPEERSLVEFPIEGNWRYEHWNRFIKTDLRPRSDGAIKIPAAPGLGVEIDMPVIKKFGKLVYRGNKKQVALFTLFDRGFKQAMYLKGKKEVQAATATEATFEIPKAPF